MKLPNQHQGVSFSTGRGISTASNHPTFRAKQTSTVVGHHDQVDRDGQRLVSERADLMSNPWVRGQEGPACATMDVKKSVVHLGGWKTMNEIVSNRINDDVKGYIEDVDGIDRNIGRDLQAEAPAEKTGSEIWGNNPMPDDAWLSLDPRASGEVGPTSVTLDVTRGIVHFDGWKHPGEIPFNGIDDDGNGYIDDVYGLDLNTGKGLQTRELIAGSSSG